MESIICRVGEVLCACERCEDGVFAFNQGVSLFEWEGGKRNEGKYIFRMGRKERTATVEVEFLLAAVMARNISSVGCHDVSLLRIISSRACHIPVL